jgi:hypothetical protein
MRVPAAAVALALGVGVSLAQSTPAKTPTPQPRLSGGFGRPRNTPVAAGEASGQSLSDAVRAAKETREQGDNPNREKSALTIDNRSLVTNPDKGRISTAKAPPGKPKVALTPVPAPADAASAAASAPAAGEPAAAASAEGEAQWRATAQAARKRVADDKARVEELAAAVKKLENDFYAWDDGQYRDRVIKPSWDKTRDQLEDAKRELEAAEKDLSDLPEKARRAGAAPGWIRE